MILFILLILLCVGFISYSKTFSEKKVQILSDNIFQGEVKNKMDSLEMLPKSPWKGMDMKGGMLYAI